MKKQKVALFHPWIKSRGGAERVILELLEKSKHDIEVYTWVYDKEKTFSEFGKYKVNLIAPGFGKKLARLHLLRGLFLPLTLLKKIPLEKYDKFLISTSGVAEFITFRNYKKGKTYAYIHTPLREANDKIIKWNLKNKYRRHPVKKMAYIASVFVYRALEKMTWKKLDVVVFNSELSLSRAIESNLPVKRNSRIIYPPIDVSKFGRLDSKKTEKLFVYYSRLNPPKRQDILIKAWNIFSEKYNGYKLIIIGTAENKQYYRRLLKLSKNNKDIRIMTDVSDKKLRELLGRSVAGIFLGYQEDFGMVPLEIVAAGKPLLAIDEGGYVKILNKNPNFYKIKEKHEEIAMVQEVAKSLESFIKKKRIVSWKRGIKTTDFVKELDTVLDSNE